MDHQWNTAIFGVGHLGWALANYRNFASLNFHLVALFDSNPAIIGQTINGVPVHSITELNTVVREKSIQIGIMAVPAGAAQTVADQLIEAGVRGIWNFAPTRIQVPEGIQLVSEDLSIGLSTLSFHLSRQIT